MVSGGAVAELPFTRNVSHLCDSVNRAVGGFSGGLHRLHAILSPSRCTARRLHGGGTHGRRLVAMHAVVGRGSTNDILQTASSRIAQEAALALSRPTEHLHPMSSASIRVVAAVISMDHRFLVCRRAPDKRHGGLWEFPGGKSEPGESDAQAIERELGEELGVAVESVGEELFAIQDYGSPFLIAFLPVRISGAPVCHEHTALRWGSFEELDRLPLAPSDRRFVEDQLAMRRAQLAVGASELT